MRLSCALLFLLGVRNLLAGDGPPRQVAPAYTTASVVNAADNQSDVLAPNTIATIYGTNLAYGTAAIGQNNIQSGLLPTVIGDCETRVFVNNYPADLYYVSPTQINFLVPTNLLPQSATVQVLVDSLAGPAVQFTLATAAPALFQLDSQNAVATDATGAVLTPSSPASPGEIVILWATGLGQVTPPVIYGQIPTAAASLVSGASLTILLDGVAVDPSAIAYAGLAPGYAGLYQINLVLPMSTGANPEIRLRLDGAISIAGVHLPVAAQTQ